MKNNSFVSFAFLSGILCVLLGIGKSIIELVTKDTSSVISGLNLVVGGGVVVIISLCVMAYTTKFPTHPTKHQ